MPDILSVIVGTKFRGDQAMSAIAKMRPGDVVELRRERENAYDSDAVACRYLGIHVGYLPRRVNVPIARAMDDGAQLTARVEQIPLFSGRRIEREPRLQISWAAEGLRA